MSLKIKLEIKVNKILYLYLDQFLWWQFYSPSHRCFQKCMTPTFSHGMLPLNCNNFYLSKFLRWNSIIFIILYWDCCLYLHCYIHNVSADASIGLFQVFHDDLGNTHSINMKILTYLLTVTRNFGVYFLLRTVQNVCW